MSTGPLWSFPGFWKFSFSISFGNCDWWKHTFRNHMDLGLYPSSTNYKLCGLWKIPSAFPVIFLQEKDRIKIQGSFLFPALLNSFALVSTLRIPLIHSQEVWSEWCLQNGSLQIQPFQFFISSFGCFLKFVLHPSSTFCHIKSVLFCFRCEFNLFCCAFYFPTHFSCSACSYLIETIASSTLVWAPNTYALCITCLVKILKRSILH